MHCVALDVAELCCEVSVWSAICFIDAHALTEEILREKGEGGVREELTRWAYAWGLVVMWLCDIGSCFASGLIALADFMVLVIHLAS